MNEKRFESIIDEETMSIMPYLVYDNEEECFYNLQGWVDLLNEQQATITELKKENERLKKRVYDFEKRKIIEESEIDEDVIPKIKLLRTELFNE